MKKLLLTTALLSILHAGLAFGGSFDISPLKVEVSAKETTGVVTLKNKDPKNPVIVHGSAFAWSQRDGADLYTDTKAIIVSPPIFTIAPDGEQVIRIATRQAPDKLDETLFRLYFKEVVDKTSTEPASVKLALNLSIPLVVAPLEGKPLPKPVWTASATSEGLTVKLDNQGQAHMKIGSITVADDQGATLGTLTAAYVLPHQSRTWNFPGVKPGKDVRLTGVTSLGELNTTLTLGPP